LSQDSFILLHQTISVLKINFKTKVTSLENIRYETPGAIDISIATGVFLINASLFTFAEIVKIFF